jgi:hypothetical protein
MTAGQTWPAGAASDAGELPRRLLRTPDRLGGWLGGPFTIIAPTVPAPRQTPATIEE